MHLGFRLISQWGPSAATRSRRKRGPLKEGSKLFSVVAVLLLHNRTVSPVAPWWAQSSAAFEGSDESA